MRKIALYSVDHDLMANTWETALSILAGNLNSGRGYYITIVSKVCQIKYIRPIRFELKKKILWIEKDAGKHRKKGLFNFGSLLHSLHCSRRLFNNEGVVP